VFQLLAPELALQSRLMSLSGPWSQVLLEGSVLVALVLLGVGVVLLFILLCKLVMATNGQ